VRRIVTLTLVGIGLGFVAGAPAQVRPADPQAACVALLQGQRITAEGRKLLQEFMGSDKAPALMDRLIHLAQGVGNGDVEAGLTRIMDKAEQGGS
jgi:hypothetical protein